MAYKTHRLEPAALLFLALIWGCTGSALSEEEASSERRGTAKPIAAANEPTVTMHRANAVGLWPSDWPVERPSNGTLLISLRGGDEEFQVIEFSLDDVSDSSERYRRKLILPISVNSFAFSPDRNWVAMDEVGGSGPSRVFTWDKITRSPMAIFHGPTDYANLRFLPGTKHLAMTSGASVWIVDLEQQRISHEWSLEHDKVEEVTRIVTDSKGSFFMAPSSDTRVIDAFELESRRPVRIPNIERIPGAQFCFRIKGKWFAYKEGVVTDLQTLTVVVKVVPAAGGVELSPDSKTLVFRYPNGYVSSERTFIVVDTETWKVRHRLKPEGDIAGQEFKFLTSDILVDPGAVTYFWNVSSGKLIARLVPWAVTEFTVKDGVKANRSDWVLALPDGRYFGSDQAHTLLNGLKTRDPKVLADFRIGLGLLPETDE